MVMDQSDFSIFIHIIIIYFMLLYSDIPLHVYDHHYHFLAIHT